MTTIVTQGGPGSWTITDDVSAQVVLLTAQVTALNTLVTANFTPAGATTPATPISLMIGINDSLANLSTNIADISTMMANMQKAQGEMTSAIGKLQNGMASVSTQIAQGVTTQQMALADQIKNNEFQQQTTNQALADAGKPPTVVQPTALKEKIVTTVQSVSVVKAESAAANLVTTTITDGFTWSYNYIADWISGTQVAKDAVSMWTDFKIKYLGFKPAEAAQATVAQTAANATKTAAVVNKARGIPAS